MARVNTTVPCNELALIALVLNTIKLKCNQFIIIYLLTIYRLFWKLNQNIIDSFIVFFS